MEDIPTYTMTPEEHAHFINTGVLPFVPLKTIEVNTAQTPEYYIKNIRENLQRNYKLIEELPEFLTVKGSENPIALVGGGPSLKGQLDKLREFNTIMACGSSHDFLVENNIIPTYSTMIDPDPVCAKYLQLHNPETKYLLASCCDKSVFDLLKERQIVVWHCHSEEFEEEIRKLQADKNYFGMGGGCTVGMRSITIAMMLGYNNVHFFGFDSCIGEGKQLHAYKLKGGESELAGFKDIRPLKFAKGTKYEKDYLCVGYQIAQAVCFRDFLAQYYECFTPTFHGGGLLSDLYDWMVGRMPHE